MKMPLLSLGTAIAIGLLGLTAGAKETIDVYNLTMQLRVPQVVDNMQSTGKRVYKLQKITGQLFVYYESTDECQAKAVELGNLVNKSFKVGGKNVTYESFPDFDSGVPRIWNAIGSNKTLVFNKSSVCFSAELEPNYALTDPGNDNSFVLVFAGSGTMSKKTIDGWKIKFPTSVSGYVAGTQGCACHDYGHVSPTRVIGKYGVTDSVVDVASVYGTWRAKYSHRIQK